MYHADAVFCISRVFGVSLFSECSAGLGFCLEWWWLGQKCGVMSRLYHGDWVFCLDGWVGELSGRSSIPYSCRGCDLSPAEIGYSHLPELLIITDSMPRLASIPYFMPGLDRVEFFGVGLCGGLLRFLFLIFFEGFLGFGCVYFF